MPLKRGEIDATDWQLLGELGRNARQSFSDIGRKVKLSPPAVAERIKQLEARQIVTGYQANVDVTELGFAFETFIRLNTDREKCRKFRRDAAGMPEILECYRVTGEGSYLIRAALKSVKELEALIDKLLLYGDPSTSTILSTAVSRRNVRNGE